MKKKMLIIGMMSLLLCGCGKIPKLENGEEAIITFKNDEKISVNDFYNEIKNSFGLQTLVSMIDKYIYEKEFEDITKEANDYAEAYIKQLRANYDSEEALLQVIQNYYGHQTIESYKNSLYLNYLQSEAIEKYVIDNITEDELKKYYENDVYPNMTISHILITPEVKDDMSEDDKKKAEETAKKKAQNIIEELNKAKKDNKDIKETFSNLAKENSEDTSTKDKGGDLGEINIGSLSNKYDELIKGAFKLEDGSYSTEVITTELGYHVILKTKTGEKKSYDDSLESMKENIATNKLDNNQSLMIEAIKHYRDKYDLDIIDSEMDSQYGKYMNNLINSAKQNSTN